MSDVTTVSAHGALTMELGAATPLAAEPTAGIFESNATVWQAPGVHTGIWECTPGTFEGNFVGYNEISTILAGRLTLQAEGEEPVDLGPGDVFVAAAGWKGKWTVHETLRKQYVLVKETTA